MSDGVNTLSRMEIASVAAQRSRFGISLPLIVGLGVYALIITHARSVLQDGDTYSHIAVGQWIIAHGTVPDHDVFSSSIAGARWIPMEWLAQVVLAWLYDHGGWAGLAAATALCAAVAVAMLLRALLEVLTPVHAMIATALACTLVFPHVVARPHIFTLPILVAWVTALVRARSKDRAPSPWLALLMIPWANLHGSYMFGLGLAVLLAGEAVLLAGDWRGRLRAVHGWGLLGALSLAAALITPFGIEGLAQPFKYFQMGLAAGVIVEEQSPNFQQFQPLELWIMGMLFAALSLGWRLPPTRVGIVLVVLHLALQHMRHGDLLGLVAPLLLAPALAPQLEAGAGGRRSLWLDHVMAELARPASLRGIAVACAVLLAVSAVAFRGGMARGADAITPAAALAAARAQHIEGPVLNDYEFGGYLMFSGVKPFIDGSRNFLYGDEFFKRAFEARFVMNDELPQLLDQYGITWTLLSPKSPSAVLLDHLPGWRRFYTDGIAVVHVREDKASR